MLTDQQIKLVADMILKMETESSLSGERTAMQELSSAQAELTKLRAELAQARAWSNVWRAYAHFEYKSDHDNAENWLRWQGTKIELVKARTAIERKDAALRAIVEYGKGGELWELARIAFES